MGKVGRGGGLPGPEVETAPEPERPGGGGGPLAPLAPAKAESTFSCALSAVFIVNFHLLDGGKGHSESDLNGGWRRGCKQETQTWIRSSKDGVEDVLDGIVRPEVALLSQSQRDEH